MKKPDNIIDVFLQPGDYYFGDQDTRIRTVLGSCVSITMWHPRLLIGGMCHYMLPTRQRNPGDDLDGRYADEAMAMFLRDVTAAETRPQEYEVKLFGGGNMFPEKGKYCPEPNCANPLKRDCRNVACRNERFALELAKLYGFNVRASHLGGEGHRNIIFDVWTGHVWLRHNQIAPIAGQAEADKSNVSPAETNKSSVSLVETNKSNVSLVETNKSNVSLVETNKSSAKQTAVNKSNVNVAEASRINVLIVDDSAVVRQVLTQTLEEDPAIRVIGAAADPIFAMGRMKAQWPDVIVLDVEMPRMNGITFLRKIMSERPTPVVICSAFTQAGADTTMQALSAGAVSIVTKPKANLKKFMEDASSDIIGAVKDASHANHKRLHVASQALIPQPKPTTDASMPDSGVASAQATERVIAIGISTGGSQALETVLAALPRMCPGIVIVQHMPEKFTAAFAQRLNSLCQIEVKEAQNKDRVIPGRALIAPGGKHMVLKRIGNQYMVEVQGGPLVNRHCPSVDVLFRSVAREAGKNATGIIMTGMGNDGAAGLLAMRNAHAHTIAQDEASCVAFEMPKEAINRGAVERVVPLLAIPGEIVNG